MTAKVCATCHDSKPLGEFNIRRSSRDGRQDRCRECSKHWYAANRETHLRNVSLNRRVARQRYRERVIAYLREHPCVDCGETDLRVLDFDHRGDELKLANVGDMIRVRASWVLIAAEIAKCDGRCANCHRRRTAAEGNWWRHVMQLADEAEAAEIAPATATRPDPAGLA